MEAITTILKITKKEPLKNHNKLLNVFAFFNKYKRVKITIISTTIINIGMKLFGSVKIDIIY